MRHSPISPWPPLFAHIRQIAFLAWLAFVLTAGVAKAQSTPETGWWWNADQEGRGYSIEVREDADGVRVFLGAYLYDDAGRPVWYVSPMNATADGSGFTGPLWHFTGGQTLFGAYAAPQGRIVSSASGVRIEFETSTSGVIVLPLPDGAQAETRIPISRFPFVGDGPPTPLPADARLPEAGWWWNPAESGRGMFFEVQSTADGRLLLYSAIYGYESTGEPSWHVGTSTLFLNGDGWAAMSMPLNQCSTGPAAAAGLSCIQLASGTTTIQFGADRETAIVTLANGRSIPVQRFRF